MSRPTAASLNVGAWSKAHAATDAAPNAPVARAKLGVGPMPKHVIARQNRGSANIASREGPVPPLHQTAGHWVPVNNLDF